MRDLKFRFWLKYAKEMMSMEDFILCCNDGDYDFADVISGNCESVIPIQYTGLKSEIGVEIYDGDVINDHIGTGLVEYIDKKASSRVNYMNGNCKWFIDYNLRGEVGSIEVIGNIHENPELIDAK